MKELTLRVNAGRGFCTHRRSTPDRGVFRVGGGGSGVYRGSSIVCACCAGVLVHVLDAAPHKVITDHHYATAACQHVTDDDSNLLRAAGLYRMAGADAV